MWRINPDDIQIHLDELPPYANKGDIISLDTEIFGIPQEKLHRPVGTFASLQYTSNGVDVYMIFDKEKIIPTLERASAGVWSMHNAQFDIRQMRRFANIPDRNKIWDTMLVEQIRYRGYYDDFGLNDLARRYLNLYLPKGEQKSFSASDRMTDEMIWYAACDVVAQHHVTVAQREVIDDDDLKIWSEIERPFLWVMLSMKGFHVDKDGWLMDAFENENEMKSIASKLPFNPGSWQQIKKFFSENYKLKLASTDEEHMLEAFEEHPDIPELEMILKYRKAQKFSGTYGAKWIEEYVEEDDRAYLPFKQIGTETARLSSPFQTVPKEGNFRSRLNAAPKHKLAIIDYSTQEPRVYAYRSQEQKLIDIFVQEKDLYISMGKEILGRDFGKKDPLRKLMKDTWLGISYDMTCKGLAKKTGGTEEEAQEILDRLHEKFPAAYAYNNEMKREKTYVTTIMGRKIWLNPNSYQCGRNAINGPIQGSSADMSKLASVRTYKHFGFNPLVHLVHDELVAEFPEQDAVEMAHDMKQIMEDTASQMHVGVPGKAELGLGDKWSDKA